MENGRILRNISRLWLAFFLFVVYFALQGLSAMDAGTQGAVNTDTATAQSDQSSDNDANATDQTTADNGNDSANSSGAYADQQSITDQLSAAISQNAAWQDQAYAASDVVDPNMSVTGLPSGTAAAIFNTTEQLFGARIAQYQQAGSTAVDVSGIYLLLSNANSLAQNNPGFFTTQTQKQIADDLDILSVEQAVFQNIGAKDFSASLDVISSALDTAQPYAFDASVQNRFAPQLTALFQARTNKSPAQLSRLTSVLSRAQKSPLLSSGGQAGAATQLATLNLENSIRAALLEKNYISQITKLAAIEKSATANSYDPLSQSINFNALQTIFNGRAGQPLPTISALISLLNTAVASELSSADQKKQLTAFLAQLALEGDIAAALAAPDYPGKLAGLSKTVTQSATSPIDATTQAAFKGALDTVFAARPTDNLDQLEQLNSLLTAALASGLLTPTDKTAVQAMVATLADDIAKAQLEEAINQALALSDPRAQLDALKKILAQAAAEGKDIDPTLQKLFGQAINNLFGKIPSEDADFLKDLADFLNDAAASPLLSADDQAHIKNTLLPQVAADQQALAQQTALAAIGKMDKIDDKIAALQKFLADNANSTLSPAVQQTLQQALTDLYNGRPNNDVDGLGKLHDFLQGLGNNSLLDPKFAAQLTNSMLPAVASDLSNAELKAQLDAIDNLPDFNSKLNALQQFMQNNPNATLDPDLQKQLQNALTDLYNKRPDGDITGLGNLGSLLQQFGTSGLVDPDFAKQITGSMLPTVTSDLSNAKIKSQLDAINKISDFNSKLNALKQFMQNNPNATLDPDLQKQLQNALTDLYNSRPEGDITGLGNLHNFLQGLAGNSMLDPAFNTHLTGMMLPTVGSDLDTATMQQQLKNISSMTDYNAATDALSQFLKDHGSKQLDPATQTQLQNLINSHFANRPLSDPDGLGKLHDLLSNLANSNLVDPDLKNQLNTSMLPTLEQNLNAAKFNHDLNSLLNNQDPNAQAQGLNDLLKNYAGAQLDPSDAAKLVDLGNNLLKLPNLTPDALQGLSDGLHTLAGRSDLPSDLKNTLQQQTLPALQDILGDKANQTALNNILQEPDLNTKIAQLHDLLGNLANQDPSNATKGLLNQVAHQLAGIKPLDPTSLQSLSGLLGGLQTNPLIDPTLQQNIKNNVLPSLEDVNTNLLAQQTLQNLTQATSISDAVNSMDQTLKNLADITLDPATQTALNNGIKHLMGLKPLDPNDLKQLSGLLGGLQTNPLVDPSLQQDIKNNVLPELQNTAANLNAQDILKNLDNENSVSDAVTQMHQALSGLAGIPLDPATQEALNNGVTHLVGLKPLDPNELAGLSGLLGSLQDNPLVDPSQQQNIKNNVLPALQNLDVNFQAQNILQNLSQQTSVTTAVSQMNQALTSLSGIPLDPATQAALNNSINHLIGLKPLDPTELASMSGLLGNLQNNPLVDPSQQQNIKNNVLPNLTTTTTDTTTENSTTTNSSVNTIQGIPSGSNSGSQSNAGVNNGMPSIALPGGHLDPNELGGLSNIPDNQQQTTDTTTSTQSTTTTQETQQQTTSTTQTQIPGLQTPEQISGGQGQAQQALPAGDPLEQELLAEIKKVMKQPDLETRIKGLDDVLSKGAGHSFSDALHDAYASALQTVFNARDAGQVTPSDAQQQQTSAEHKKALKAHSHRKPHHSKRNHKPAKPKKGSATAATASGEQKAPNNPTTSGTSKPTKGSAPKHHKGAHAAAQSNAQPANQKPKKKKKKKKNRKHRHAKNGNKAQSAANQGGK